MRRIPSWSIILAIVVIAVVVGGGLGWWVSRDNLEVPKKAVATEDTTHVAQTATTTVQPAATPKVATTEPAVAPTEAATEVAAVPATGDGQWQDALDQVLTSEGEPEQKAERLLRMLPLLKEEAQVEVSQHLVNFVSDEGYKPLAQILTNATTAEAVDGVLMTDLLNRNDGIKLPLLLSLARNEGHPKHGEAKELLELYLQENHGDDWTQWESSVTNYLAQNVPADMVLDTAPAPTGGTTTANP